MTGAIQSAEVVLPCRELDSTLSFFTERLGFQVDSIFPADDPAVAQISGYGLQLRLQRGAGGDHSVLRLHSTAPETIAGGALRLTAPNGTAIDLVRADAPIEVPPARQGLVISRIGDGSWGSGRAGMQYRDLVPGRQGGRIIASHIRIPGGGPVPDYVHFHKIRFQVIYCHRGWARLVYEDQGPPFLFTAGDCVLQPPQIRHRVLESGDDLEVIEVGCPAEHMTCVDHRLTLPTAQLRTERDFLGQRFIHHRAAEASWRPWRLSGFEARDTGIGAASGGVGSVHVVRTVGARETGPVAHDADTLFLFVLRGGMTLQTDQVHPLAAGDSLLLPAGPTFHMNACTADLELLVVGMPADFSLAS